jgi:hypothetical protein
VNNETQKNMKKVKKWSKMVKKRRFFGVFWGFGAFFGHFLSIFIKNENFDQLGVGRECSRLGGKKVLKYDRRHMG